MQVMGLDWRPKISPDAQEVLEKCGSSLGQMYILGACHSMANTGLEYSHCSQLQIKTADLLVDNRNYTGILVVQPWEGWYLPEFLQGLRREPPALLFVPQYNSPEKDIIHDLALFYGDDKVRPSWSRRHVIEITAHGVDGDSREKEILRDSGLSYRVERLYEEVDNPKRWFQKIILADILQGYYAEKEKNIRVELSEHS